MRIRGDDDALCAGSSIIRDRHVCTREQPHGQMKSPSIAQRGEGGVRGGSGESDLLSRATLKCSVMLDTTNQKYRDQSAASTETSY